jgi:F-type H+-transporting ATPase subunit b
MEETLRALGGILLNAVPTFILVILLHFFLKYSFFRPLERVLTARYEATEGARKLAEETVAKAEAKAREYEAAMRAARAEIYQAEDQIHRRLVEERAAQVRTARAGAEAAIKAAKAELAADAARARRVLEYESERLAGQIADVVLKRGAA